MTATSRRGTLSRAHGSWGVWWQSRDSTQLLWTILLALVGTHAVLVGYAAIWVVWVGPVTGLDTDTASLVPQSILDSCIGYAVASLALFLGTSYASGHRQEREPGKVIFVLTATYCGFAVGYVWLRFSLPTGVLFTDAWLPVEAALIAPLLWPMYAAAALMTWQVARRRRPVYVVR